MSKFALLLVICLLLCSCSARQEKPFETETENTTTSEAASTSSETSAAHTAPITAATEKAELSESDIIVLKAELGVNEDGTLSEKFVKRIEELMKLDHEETGIVYPSLYDFDDDGIPEIFLIIHNGGQGYMPCKVYSAIDFSYLGEFEGFCRDGFTHLENSHGGTMIHSYYEHSAQLRREDYVFAKLVNGKLETTWLYGKEGGIRGGELNPTVYTEVEMGEEALERISGLGGYVWKDIVKAHSLISYYDGCAFTSYDTGADSD